MGKFSQIASENTGHPFVSKELKPALVEKRIPFDVTAVRGPITKSFAESAKRLREISTYYLDIAFSDVNVKTFGLEPEMTLSFTAGYEGRDRLIEALREDLDNGVVNSVVLTGNQDWYSLGVGS